jgi:glutamate synthase (NADPH/NADH) large chain
LWDPESGNRDKVNPEMVDLDPLDGDDVEWLRDTLAAHHQATGSAVAARLLALDDRGLAGGFVKVMPRDYKRVLEAARQAEEDGMSIDDAIMAAAHG